MEGASESLLLEEEGEAWNIAIEEADAMLNETVDGITEGQVEGGAESEILERMERDVMKVMQSGREAITKRIMEKTKTEAMECKLMKEMMVDRETIVM